MRDEEIPIRDEENDPGTPTVNGPELVENRGNPVDPSPRYKFVRLLGWNVIRTSGAMALVALLIVTAVAVPAPLPVAADDPWAPAPTPDDDGANETVAAGEHLAGSLSVQRESVDRNLSKRTLTVTVETAPTDDAKADYLTGECDRVRLALNALKQRARALQGARSNGSITSGEFRARMTELDALAETVEQLSATCLRSSRIISNESLSRFGFNDTAMIESRRTASTFRSEELAGHTLNLTGRNVSGATVAGYEVLTNDSLENATIDQLELLAEAKSRRALLVEQNESAADFVAEHAPDDGDAAAALSCAASELSAAEDDIEAARRAADEGDDDAFSDSLAAARGHMDAAEECIERAYEEAGT